MKKQGKTIEGFRIMGSRIADKEDEK